MKNVKLLTRAEIEKIGKCYKSKYSFDVSRISEDVFNSLIKTLKVNGLRGIKGIGFNYDLFVKTYRRIEEMKEKNPKDQANQIPCSLEASAALKAKEVTTLIVNTVIKMIENDKSIELLKFRSIPFKFSDLDLLSSCIYGNSNLRVIKFCDVPLGDKGFERLGRALRKQSVVKLQCRQCKLTDKSSIAFRSLLSFHLFVQSDYDWKTSLSGAKGSNIVCLNSLDFRDNEFTYKFIEEVKDSLIDIPLKKLDLRGNNGITALTVHKLLPAIPNTNILTGIQVPPKSHVSIKSTMNRTSSSHSSPIPVKSSIEIINSLEKENEVISRLIEQIQSKDPKYQLEKGLLILGEKAESFIEEIKRIDSLLIKSTNGPPPFLSINLEKYQNKSKKEKSKSYSLSPRKNLSKTQNNY